MKTRKGIAAVLAGVMALAALPFSALSAGAESAYAPGDVDMDGYITAHDAAVVSRALYVDETALNDEQKQLADVNGDGVVDQTDADWIYEHSEYKLGAVNQKEYMSSTTLFYQRYYIARKGAAIMMRFCRRIRFRKVPQRRMKCTMTTVSPRCATTCWT